VQRQVQPPLVRYGYAILVVITALALRAFDLEGHRDTQDGQLAVTIS
jgi:hypothetical protein